MPTPALQGRVVEIGNIVALDGAPGIVITCDREALKQFPDNLFGMRVSITRFHESVETGKPKEGKPA